MPIDLVTATHPFEVDPCPTSMRNDGHRQPHQKTSPDQFMMARHLKLIDRRSRWPTPRSAGGSNPGDDLGRSESPTLHGTLRSLWGIPKERRANSRPATSTPITHTTDTIKPKEMGREIRSASRYGTTHGWLTHTHASACAPELRSKDRNLIPYVFWISLHPPDRTATTRKPRPLLRTDGAFPRRRAARQLQPPVHQHPPRNTRLEAVEGP